MKSNSELNDLLELRVAFQAELQRVAAAGLDEAATRAALIGEIDAGLACEVHAGLDDLAGRLPSGVKEPGYAAGGLLAAVRAARALEAHGWTVARIAAAVARERTETEADLALWEAASVGWQEA